MSSHETAAPRVTALLADVLERCAHGSGAEEPREKVSLGTLIEALDERAFGLGILILALPCAVPFLYGIPQIVALPMLALAGQLALGREHPWLPEGLAKRNVSVGGLRQVVGRAQRTIGFIERLAAPRLAVLSDGFGARVVGGLMLIPTASILVPLPLTNSTPAIGVGIAAVGLLERDGLLIILGLLLGIGWVVLLLLLGVEGISLLKDAVLGLFSSGPPAT